MTSEPHTRIDLVSLATLFLCLVSIALSFVGILRGDASEWVIVPGAVGAVISITTLRKDG